MTDQQHLERLQAFTGIWYAAEKIDHIKDYLRGSQKQKIKNIGRDILEIEHKTFKVMQIQNEAQIAERILITNDCIDKLVEILDSQDVKKVNEIFKVLGLDYEAE